MWSLTEENPWNIQSLYDLQFFNCPSCDFKDYLKQEFVNHAYNFHPEAWPYLNNIKDGSLDDIIIPNDDDSMIDLKPDFSSPNTGLDIKVEEFDDMEINENVEADDQKWSIDNSDVALENIKTEKNYYNENQETNCNHKCEHCDDAFFTKKELISHYNEEHEDLKLFKCNDCEESFGTSKQLISHTRYSKECGNTNQLFTMKRGKKLAKKQCEVCNLWVEKFYFPKHVLKHEKMAERSKCDQCEEEFPDILSLKVHIRKVHKGKGSRKKQCEICTMWVFSRIFSKHLKKHENGEISHCELCQQEFPDLLLLKVHIRDVHGGKKKEKLDSQNRPRIKCDKCNKLFRETHYPKHVALRHQEGSFMCEQCAKVFNTKYNLNSHVKIVHGENTHKACKICGKMLTKAAMKMHISSVHEKNKNWVCMTCGKAHSEKGSLVRHEQRVHGGIRKHKCTFPNCEWAFHANQDLKKHIETVHEGRKDHKCTHCGKAFGSLKTMKRHRETVHEGVKKFKCHLCSNAYGQSHELKKHLINFHKQIIPKFKPVAEFQKQMSSQDDDVK